MITFTIPSHVCNDLVATIAEAVGAREVENKSSRFGISLPRKFEVECDSINTVECALWDDVELETELRSRIISSINIQ